MRNACSQRGEGRASAGGHGHFVAALAQGRQDKWQRSASGEYICGSGGMAQAEGQGYNERGVLVVWRVGTRQRQEELQASVNGGRRSK
jgi:hypothetical protein